MTLVGSADGQALLMTVAGAAYGLLLIGLGQVFSALREIALNTRASRPADQPPVSSSPYVGLQFISGVMAFVGVIIAAVCIVLVVGAASHQ